MLHFVTKNGMQAHSAQDSHQLYSNLIMLKIAKRILGIRTDNIDRSDPSLKQYFIDHTAILNRLTEHQEHERKSTKSWEVTAVEMDSDGSECYDSVRAVILVKRKAKSASIETDQGSVMV